jgi:fructoselysine-6-P-deglycase FrlB-like protein
VSLIEREIATQPECWRKAAEVAQARADSLPASGERVAAVGCGTSWFIAQAYAGLREAAGRGETDAFPASEMPLRRAYDRIVVVSRSGTTTEVVDLLARLDGRPTVAVTADGETPVGRAAAWSVELPFADEASVVQTRFATSALALLRAHLGHDLERLAGEAEKALGVHPAVNPAAFRHFVFLGREWSVALAHESALKFREAAGAWTESYPAMEYRHGPISVAGDSTVVWMLGEGDPELEADVRATGARVITSELDPMAELVRVQRAAVRLALGRGLDPDQPRHLSRSVVLS